MAGVTNFKDRVIDLAGSLGTADDNAIEQWILDGCYDVINRVQSRDNPMEFVTRSGPYTGTMAISLTEIRHVIAADRNEIECKSVTHKKRHLYDSIDSIYEVTANDPVMYIHNNELVIKPAPTALERGYYSYVPEYSITNFSSGVSSIENFPNKYYEHIILFAALMTVARRMQDLMDDTAVNTMYSLDNIRNMINNDIPTADTDLFGLLADEDIDMVAATVGVSTEAAKLISQKYNWLKERVEILLAQYIGKFPEQSALQTRGKRGR